MRDFYVAVDIEGEVANPPPVERDSKRRKVNQACVYCQRSHITCDNGRPCQRCIKRRIGHLCHDPPVSFAQKPSTLLSPMVACTAGRHRTQTSVPQGNGKSPLTSSSRVKEAARMLLTLHDQVNSIIRQHAPEPAGSKDHPFDEEQSHQSLLQLINNHYSLEGKTRVCASFSQLHARLARLRETQGAANLIEASSLVRLCSLEFDRVLMTTSTPHLLIKLGGAILKANSSLASIVKIPVDELVKQWHICELLTEESYMEFVEKTTKLLFPDENCVGSILTVCMLVPGGLRSLTKGGATTTSATNLANVGTFSSLVASGDSSRASLNSPAAVRCVLSISSRYDRQHVPLLMVLSLIPLPDWEVGVKYKF